MLGHGQFCRAFTCCSPCYSQREISIGGNCDGYFVALSYLEHCFGLLKSDSCIKKHGELSSTETEGLYLYKIECLQLIKVIHVCFEFMNNLLGIFHTPEASSPVCFTRYC